MTQFSDFPFELRSTIWMLTIEPRIVEIRFKIGLVPPLDKNRHVTQWGVLYASSPTPVPAALQTCHEARSLLARHYERAFTHGTEPRHVWVNFDMDIISIDRSSNDWTGPEVPRIRRLKFARKCDECYFEDEHLELDFLLPNLQEIYIVCLDGPEAWYRAEDPFYRRCPRENVWLINTETNEMVTLIEIQKRVKRSREEARRQEAEEAAKVRIGWCCGF
ncbi:hypothetical protein THAR02_00831 [Trichoderma harzianum]|uniref:2EXR domain-containing protein n=1 Tax=Trichoderma harzianum TaxID=5544 RepID=A0A0G0A4B2_TRIHA|nr:hypothetical protein THAR02_00831 [Trichoderma harzianum]